MAWDSRYFEVGVVKIVNGNVQLMLPHGYFETVYVGNAVAARWQGDYLVVELSNGQIRKYDSKSSFTYLSR